VSGKAGGYERSAGGMVGALVVLVALVLAWIGFKALTTKGPASPVHTVDYTRVVPTARRAADFDLVAPASLPHGWRATTVGFTDRPAHWHLGVLTDRGRYVGLEQGDGSVRSALEQYVDRAPSRGRPVDVAGRPWSTYTDAGGDLALVRREGRTTTLVVGHDVPKVALVSYAASLR
jgi:Protein of unknown function (DUF4245)